MSDRTAAPRVTHRRNLSMPAVLGLLFILRGGADVSADGWKIQLQGVKALGLGYAGAALAEDATTVWFNPAGMTQLDTPWTVTSGGVWIPFSLDYTDVGSLSVLGQRLSGPSTSNGGKRSFVPVPHLYVVHKLNDRVWAGIGLTSPYGLSDDYGDTWVGRYHATESTLKVISLNPVVAYKVNNRMSLGAGLALQRSSVTIANRVDFGSLGAALGLPLVPQGHDGEIVLNASDWAFGVDLSAAWQITLRSRIATTYRSQIEHTLKGTADFDVPAAAALLRATGAFSATPATAMLPMPHELLLSTAFDLSANRKWVLVCDFTWTDWSRFERLTVAFENPAQPPLAQDARYEDSRRGAIGAMYRPSNRWTFGVGGLFEDVPVPDSTRNPRLPEVNNVGFSAGGTYRLNARTDLDFSWSHLIPHDAQNSADRSGCGQHGRKGALADRRNRVRIQPPVLGAPLHSTPAMGDAS